MNNPTSLLEPSEIKPLADQIGGLLGELDRILLGRPELHRLVVIGILSRGHVLLEGVPGVGKTALIKALGHLLGLTFSRVQFTPDLMPGDILGTNILQETENRHREMLFQPGPIFTNILLADEINRASPKTQSALLEAMQEHCVTLLGQTRPLPNPFFVLASQNPIELEGTYPLPEAQLDRFLFKLHVEMPAVNVLQEMITLRRHGTPPEPQTIFDAELLQRIFISLEHIFLPAAVAAYIARLVAATHPNFPEAPSMIRDYVNFGASPRAAIAIAEAARTAAFLAGRPSAGFEDVRFVAAPVLNHRLLLGYKARMDKVDTTMILKGLLESVKEIDTNLPSDIHIDREIGKYS
ncbi:MAG: AAA family ATPase [Planctomycetaceae bacterium]|jgi:MoxR-like ATPase|nr:AAA family ATPase [Planctomycetaceae bacterium]